MSLESLIRVEALGLRYGRRWIFRGLEFGVEQGQILAVLGKNGSGKSTLLRILSGLQRPSEGEYHLCEGDPRVTVGYAALEMALYPELSVNEHLAFTSSLRGCAARAEELLDYVGLSAAKKVSAEHLSSGMKVRLKLALALQPQPRILLLDEPSASLDGDGRKLVSRICEEQSQNGCVILATNDPLEKDLATHILNLDR